MKEGDKEAKKAEVEGTKKGKQDTKKYAKEEESIDVRMKDNRDAINKIKKEGIDVEEGKDEKKKEDWNQREGKLEVGRDEEGVVEDLDVNIMATGKGVDVKKEAGIDVEIDSNSDSQSCINYC